jgi:hypothetical protein
MRLILLLLLCCGGCATGRTIVVVRGEVDGVDVAVHYELGWAHGTDRGTRRE